MKTITFKFNWIVYDLKKIQEVLSNYNTLQLTDLASDPFCSPDYPSVAWELHINVTKGYSYFSVWLRQIGPNSLKDLVKTKYKIYALNESKRVDIAEFAIYIF
uniref:MATH domain-containing protein n=1 Tax=Meloidogyne hapla TaxID=6305 RepID=A0A1I8BVX9_MELHA